mgnify:CR=1 FL=1
MKKSFHRTDRVSAQLRRELGAIVHAMVREHALPSVSVSDVEVTRDLAHAKVFFTALQQERAKEALTGLKALVPEIRRALSLAVRMRHTPELHFVYDDSVDRGERIDTLLREVGEGDALDGDDDGFDNAGSDSAGSDDSASDDDRDGRSGRLSGP